VRRFTDRTFENSLRERALNRILTEFIGEGEPASEEEEEEGTCVNPLNHIEPGFLLRKASYEGALAEIRRNDDERGM
jgi:hypothetical protein